jgi:hypothetical protein
MVNAQRLRSGHLWQNRFYSRALPRTHLWRALAYRERNPVRTGDGRATGRLLNKDFRAGQGGAAG